MASPWAPTRVARAQQAAFAQALSHAEEQAATAHYSCVLLLDELRAEDGARDARRQERLALTAELRNGEAHALQLLHVQRHALRALGAQMDTEDTELSI